MLAAGALAPNRRAAVNRDPDRDRQQREVDDA